MTLDAVPSPQVYLGVTVGIPDQSRDGLALSPFLVLEGFQKRGSHCIWALCASNRPGFMVYQVSL
jgi:hypothetical protein